MIDTHRDGSGSGAVLRPHLQHRAVLRAGAVKLSYYDTSARLPCRDSRSKPFSRVVGCEADIYPQRACLRACCAYNEALVAFSGYVAPSVEAPPSEAEQSGDATEPAHPTAQLAPVDLPHGRAPSPLTPPLSTHSRLAASRVRGRERGLASPTGRAPNPSQSLFGPGAVVRRRLEQSSLRPPVFARPVAETAGRGAVPDRALDLVHRPALSRLGGMRLSDGAVTSQSGALVQ